MAEREQGEPKESWPERVGAAIGSILPWLLVALGVFVLINSFREISRPLAVVLGVIISLEVVILAKLRDLDR